MDNPSWSWKVRQWLWERCSMYRNSATPNEALANRMDGIAGNANGDEEMVRALIALLPETDDFVGEEIIALLVRKED
jgi:hypothetical protein